MIGVKLGKLLEMHDRNRSVRDEILLAEVLEVYGLGQLGKQKLLQLPCTNSRTKCPKTHLQVEIP